MILGTINVWQFWYHGEIETLCTAYRMIPRISTLMNASAEATGVSYRYHVQYQLQITIDTWEESIWQTCDDYSVHLLSWVRTDGG